MKNKAFTLAEIMIVLSVIAVLTAILLPAARNAMPNENVMKFKKAHSVLNTAVRELVNSDKYFLDGDFGLKPDATGATPAYLCNAFGDILTTKNNTCADDIEWISMRPKWTTEEQKTAQLNTLDGECTAILDHYDSTSEKFSGLMGISSFILPDETLIYISGSVIKDSTIDYRDYLGFDARGFYACIDLDGIPKEASRTDCVNECPFGYLIRADGKIFNSPRVNEWLSKSIQDKD